MATLLSTIRTNARIELKETTASFWTDAELLTHEQLCINDLWGAIIDLNGTHFQTIDVTTMSIAAEATSIATVPSDVFRILLIEPRDTTSAGSSNSLLFVPKKYNDPEFISARAMSSLDPLTAGIVYYDVVGAGAPVAAPTILIAPKLSSAVNLRVHYIPVAGSDALTAASNNPIPGESDRAIMAWTVAFARAKEREDRSPDPAWLAIYATEKQNILTRLTPRQTQEPEIVGDMFGEMF